jgi:uncharacterized protein YecT (DUF1311 family)
MLAMMMKWPPGIGLEMGWNRDFSRHGQAIPGNRTTRLPAQHSTNLEHKIQAKALIRSISWRMVVKDSIGFQRGGFMKRVIATFCLLASTLLAGCNRQSAADCSAEDSFAAVVPIVQNRIVEKTRERIRQTNGARPASNARVRATVNQAAMTITDVRTTQADPNSTRRFCVGRLKVTIPAQVLQEADRGRQAAGTNSITELADSGDIDRNADSFTADIEYNVQPTDDGNRIYAEIENSDPYVNFVSEVLAFYLLRPAVEQARLERDRAAAEQHRIEQQQQQEQDAALAEQRGAVLDQARSEHRLAEQTINEVWRAVPPNVREQLLELQRTWIRRKNADCRIESASVSTEPQEREAARLRCDTRVTNDRIRYLRQYAGY